MNKYQEFLPAFKENNVVVILSSSNFFVPYLSVCIESIISNADDKYNYDIIIFERNISKYNKDIVLSMIKEKLNISLRFINISETVKKINFYVNSDRISQETYYGLLIPFILINYDRAIIMDCDMIVRTDISELFFEELEDKIAGGINDIVLQGWLSDKENDTFNYYTKYLKIENPFNCFNGGLILLDFNKYRKSFNKNIIIKYINNYKLRVVDQDIFNLLLVGKVKLLDYKWNHMINVKGAISDAIEKSPKKAQEKYFLARTNPGIIHYAGEQKPWINPEVEFSNEFWTLARKNPYYEVILYRMCETMINKYGINFSEYNKDKHRIKSLKIKVKNFIKIFLPKGTKRHRFVKKLYFKLRGWPFVE